MRSRAAGAAGSALPVPFSSAVGIDTSAFPTFLTYSLSQGGDEADPIHETSTHDGSCPGRRRRGNARVGTEDARDTGFSLALKGPTDPTGLERQALTRVIESREALHVRQLHRRR